MKTACEQCPWRKTNQGKRAKSGFYTKANLTRLWNGIRKGNAQSCHLTDPSHPDHVTAGAPLGAKAQECPGSIILVLRELKQMASEDRNITPETIIEYEGKRGKSKIDKNGQRYWLVARYMHGGTPFVGGAKLPDVDASDDEVGLPDYLSGVPCDY